MDKQKGDEHYVGEFYFVHRFAVFLFRYVSESRVAGGGGTGGNVFAEIFTCMKMDSYQFFFQDFIPKKVTFSVVWLHFIET